MHHSYELFHEYEKFEWLVKEIDWSAIDKSLVQPADVMLARSAVMGECNSIAALHGFLNESGDDYDFAAYASLWGYQELKHHYVFKTWLRHIGEDVEDNRVEAMRTVYPPGITPAATLATNIISEFTVCHVYQFLSRHVEEPVLKDILSKASRDEARHAREFLYYTSRRIKRYPRELQSVLETLYVYTADPDKLIKHPVSVFKGDLPELSNHETIDDGFMYFMQREDVGLERLRQKIFNAFSGLTGYKLTKPSLVRRAIADCMEKNEAAQA
jgi:hypothetical protein